MASLLHGPGGGNEHLSIGTRAGRCITFPVTEVNVLAGAGRGVAALKMNADDRVLGFVLTTQKMVGLIVETNRQRRETITPNKFASSRAGRGRELLRAGYLARVIIDPHLMLRRTGERGTEPTPADALPVVVPAPPAPPDTRARDAQGKLL